MFSAEKGETRQNPETELRNEPEKDESYSPRGVLDVPILSSDSDQSSSSSSSFSFSRLTEKIIDSPNGAPIRNPAAQPQRHWRSVIDLLKKKSSRKFSTIAFLGSLEGGSRKGTKKKLARNWSAEDGIDCGALPVPKKPSWRNFDLAELSAATDNFSPVTSD
ncbi:hypothetical protein CRG98_018123 [Punica granatum]|uniref:Uncharacterized protein n=1 Tax=Punica granatum TaxID=22663 RepID=A0A2I0K009_PUNGR|nr:hypothetical protein CRG98_018123 [Punica granatum]